MIHKEQLFQYIRSPESIDDESIEGMSDMLEKYPFFHTGHMLFLKALYKKNHWRFKSQIKISSAFIIDKKKLYQLLFREEAEEHEASDKQSDVLNKNEVNTFDDNTRGELPENNEEELMFILDETGQENTCQKTIEIGAEQNQFSEMQEENGLLVIEDTPFTTHDDELKHKSSKSEPAKQKNKGNDLIDRFIQNEPGRIRADENNTLKNEDLSKSSTKEDGGFYTETLGNIYIQQGYYKKAIHVFQKLSLKYPKKNDYFAAKIKELNQIINKSKK